MLLAPAVARAHARVPGPATTGGASALDLATALVLALAALVYASGTRRVWGRAGAGRGVLAREVACFAAGWTVLAVALLSPLDRLAGTLFSAHMAQHELLMLVAAPLLVGARPHKAAAWGLPAPLRAPVMGLVRSRPARAAWRAGTGLRSAWLLHGGALWAWHAPPLYEASLRSDAVHALQHASFFGSAVVWWASLAAATARGSDRHAGALASLFTTALHAGALGALLVFSRAPWIDSYAASAPRFGLSALEDQQLAGLLMWIPAGLLFAGVGIALVWSWLREGERRVRTAP